MDTHTIVTLLLAFGSLVQGALGQHFLKANPQFSTTLAHAAMFGLALLFYGLANGWPHTADAGQWIMAGLAWAGSLGIAGPSVLAGAGVIAKTDSKGT